MSDTAAFFANKKKKKKAKAFKFNANLVDASTVVSSTVHVDAPALSTNHEAVPVVGEGEASTEKESLEQDQQPQQEGSQSEQWDDEAMAAATYRKQATVSAGGVAGATPATAAQTTELLEVKSMGSKRTEEEDIAEKLRVEETKAQLAAAKEGMEREAAKFREELDKKKQGAEPEKGAGPRFGAAAAAAMGGSGGKWLPPHMRGGGGGWGVARTTSQKLDTQDQELFPDLASADKILEKKEKKPAPVFKVPKKTPVGGGASWASKPANKPAEAEAAPPKMEQAPVPAPEAPKQEEPKAAESFAVAKAPAKKTVTKKKKKDLSTFKPGGS